MLAQKLSMHAAIAVHQLLHARRATLDRLATCRGATHVLACIGVCIREPVAAHLLRQLSRADLRCPLIKAHSCTDPTDCTHLEHFAALG